MKASYLKLNQSKTQFIQFFRKTNPSSVSPLQLDDQVYVSPTIEVRNLGVLMDSKPNFHSHVSEMRVRVQTIQNSCAKCLTRIYRFASAPEAKITLHWLPIRVRSRFKIPVFAD